jgi:hypothetical protein
MEMSMVSEGYYATKSAYKLNQGYGAKTPIIDAVYEILYEGKDARAVFKKLTDGLNTISFSFNSTLKQYDTLYSQNKYCFR